MAETLSGFVCGFALALLVTPLLAVALLRARVNSPTLERLVPKETNILALSMLLHSGAFLAFTGIGIVLGMMLYGIEDARPAGGLGSPNAFFTLLVLAITAIAVVPMAVVLPRQRGLLLAAAVVFAVTFGWVMPYLSLVGADS
jgi:hypothetical protein